MDQLGLISGSHSSSRFSLDELRRSLFEDPFLAPASTSPSAQPQPTYLVDEHDDLSPPASPPLPPSPKPEDPHTIACLPSDSPFPTKPPGTRPRSSARDDLSLRSDPSRHVDYLSQDWHEDDISSSWRHISVNRKEYGQVSRLENASWRAWAKSRFRLATVSPETLNWFKERDITWLYGPLQQSTGFSATDVLPGPAGLHPAAADDASGRDRRSILKKMDMLEVMTRRSTFSLSVIMQAAGAIQTHHAGMPAAEQRPGQLGRSSSTPDLPGATFTLPVSKSASSSSSSSSSFVREQPCAPPPKEKRHIRFNEVVEQRITLRRRKDRSFPAAAASPPQEEEQLADDEDDAGLEMKPSSSGPTKRRSSRRSNKPPQQRADPDAGGQQKKLETIKKLPDGSLNSAAAQRSRRG